MTTEAIQAALDALESPLYVEGVLPPTSNLAVDALRLDAPDFVERLIAESERAPFGHHEMTRLDEEVRHALRLRSRMATTIEGLDVRPLLDEIEAAISPVERLRAQLLDVHIYPPGGHFRPHKDTPREEGMVGTLVVWLPIPHEGGALLLSDGVSHASVSASTEGLRWAAFTGDVQHAVEPVTSGHRITVAYALMLAGVSREVDLSPSAPLVDAVRAYLEELANMPQGGVLALECTRQIIAPRKVETALDVRMLRSVDRVIAMALHAAKIPVGVRACVAASQEESQLRYAHCIRLRRVLGPREAAGWSEYVSIEPPEGDYVEPGEGTALEGLVSEDFEAPTEFVLRAHSTARLIHEACYSGTGYFGNECYDALLYSFAAIEIPVGDLKARGMGPPEAPRRRVVHAKFGEGEVLSEDTKDDLIEVQFRREDGTPEVRRLLSRFLRDA